MKPRDVTNQPPRKQAGMTLIELMIVVVIVGILASVAYPGYQEYVRRAKRSEAKALLADISARMERFYFDNNTYTLTMTSAGLGYGSATPSSAEGHYTASVAAGASGIATSYVATVTPVGFTDSKCGNLTLDSRGVKGTSTGDDEECWH